jgi:D-alanine-D-alanine ligase
MKVCVLQPDYTGSPVDYGNYDPKRDLAPWLPGHQVDNLFLRKSTSYAQLMKASIGDYDIYINLCEGYPEWDIPGFDVIWALERLNLPFTGTTMRNFLHSKETMKVVAHSCGVATAAWWIVHTAADVEAMPACLRFPLFVKPADSGDSLGIDEHSLVQDNDELHKRCAELLPEFNKLLIEEYVDGREFTVLIAASPDGPLAFTPFEFVFDTAEHFKTYRMKVTEHHGTNNVPVTDAALSTQLKEMAVQIFRAFDAESYARIDIRSNQAGKLFFLEINCECSIFYPEGSEGSADYILKHEAIGHAGFLRLIIDDGIRRHQQRQKRFDVRMGADGKVGCFATRDLARGESIQAGPFRQSAAAAANLASHDDKLFTQRLVRKGEELLVAASE